MAIHEAVVAAHIGEALPGISRHAAEDRSLAMHHFVMGERQHKIFGEGIVQAEDDIAVVMLAIDRILADVVEGVVHPAHIPFVAEAEPAKLDRPRHHRPGC